MWGRTFILALSSFTILATSFCVQKKHARDVSSGEGYIVEGIEPRIYQDKNGHQIFIYEKELNERHTYIQVKYLCHGQKEPAIWDEIEADHVFGDSEGLVEGSKFVIQYRPMQLLDFNVKGTKPSDREKRANVDKDNFYDLNLACNESLGN